MFVEKKYKSFEECQKEYTSVFTLYTFYPPGYDFSQLEKFKYVAPHLYPRFEEVYNDCVVHSKVTTNYDIERYKEIVIDFFQKYPEYFTGTNIRGVLSKYPDGTINFGQVIRYGGATMDTLLQKLIHIQHEGVKNKNERLLAQLPTSRRQKAQEDAAKFLHKNSQAEFIGVFIDGERPDKILDEHGRIHQRFLKTVTKEVPVGHLLSNMADFKASGLSAEYWERFRTLHDEWKWSSPAIGDVTGEQLRKDQKDAMFYWYATFIRCTADIDNLDFDATDELFDIVWSLRGTSGHICRYNTTKLIAFANAIAYKMLPASMLQQQAFTDWFKDPFNCQREEVWTKLIEFSDALNSTGTDVIFEFVKNLLETDPKAKSAAKDYLAGNPKAINTLKGPILKTFKGTVNPQSLETELKPILEQLI